MAWSVQIDETVTRLLVNMDDKTQESFVMAMVSLGDDPFRGRPYGPDSPRMALPLGDLGVVLYALMPDERAVVILDLVWIG